MQSVKTALLVLETVAARQPVGLSELARALAVPKSTVQRCLSTLQEAGWLTPAGDASGRWLVTGKAFSVGSQFANRQDLRTIALPALSEVQAASLETVHLMVLDRDELVLVERLDSAHPLRTFNPIGSRVPLHATATGKAVLATLPADRLDAYLRTAITPMTSHTIVDGQVLRAQLAQIRRDGYAVNDQELEIGVAAVGSSVRTPGGDAVGALSISAPRVRLGPERYSEYGRLVSTAASRIGALLTDHSAPPIAG